MTGAVHAVADHDLVSARFHRLDGGLKARTQVRADPAGRRGDADEVAGA
jgi:hypothetical protein